MKTNDVLGLLIIVFLVILLFRFFSSPKNFSDILGLKVITTPNLVEDLDIHELQNRPRFNNGGSSQGPVTVCPSSVLNTLSGSDGGVETPDGTSGIQGMIYGVVRCRGSVITEYHADPLVVGLFPAQSSSDFDNGWMRSPVAAIETTLCASGASDTCYQFSSIAPGTYSVLVDRGGGWYCDRGACRVVVSAGTMSTFNIVTDK